MSNFSARNTTRLILLKLSEVQEYSDRRHIYEMYLLNLSERIISYLTKSERSAEIFLRKTSINKNCQI